jgi:sugar lactone lactonase YvrE
MIRRLLVLLCVCSFVPAFAGTSLAQPTFNPYNGHSYLVVSGDWFGSETNAIALGGHLVTVNNQVEQDWLEGNFGTDEFYWIGYTDASSEGNWVWVSAETPNYTNWAPGEPNNAWPSGEHYAIMNWTSTIITDPGLWNDIGLDSPEWNVTTMGIAEYVPEPNIPTVLDPRFSGVERFADGLAGPTGLAFDDEGNLCVTNEMPVWDANANSNTVSKITPNGDVSVFANSFWGPSGIAFNAPEGNLYVSEDGSHQVWKVDPSGSKELVVISTGNTNAIAFDASWTLYLIVCEEGEGIYKVTPAGNLEVFVDNPANDQIFNCPQAGIFDQNANLYVSDFTGTVFQITPEGVVSIYATFPGSTEGGLAFDKNGNLYVSSTDLTVYRIPPGGGQNVAEPFVTGFTAGDPGYFFPRGLVFDGEGNLYIAEHGTGIVWKVLIDIYAVVIDIKPGSDPNCFNINGKGVIPVAINGSEDFDVTQIDTSTLEFGGLEVRVKGNDNPQCAIGDWNNDGFDDLVCQFEDNDQAWDPGTGEATLTGSLLDGRPIAGTDSICIVP